PPSRLWSFHHEIAPHARGRLRIWPVSFPVVGHPGRDVEPGVARGNRFTFKHTVMKPPRVNGLLLKGAGEHVGLKCEYSLAFRAEQRRIQFLLAILPDALEPFLPVVIGLHTGASANSRTAYRNPLPTESDPLCPAIPFAP